MKKISVLSVLLILLSACQKERLPIDDSSLDDKLASEEVLFQYAVIGEKHKNPLDIKNVISAFNQLPISTKSGINVEDIKPTHKYVAFTPSTEDEYYALDEIDEDVVTLSSYPLDYDVSDGLIVPDDRFVTNGFSY